MRKRDQQRQDHQPRQNQHFATLATAPLFHNVQATAKPSHTPRPSALPHSPHGISQNGVTILRFGRAFFSGEGVPPSQSPDGYEISESAPWHFSEWRDHIEIWARFFVARASRPRSLWLVTKFRKVPHGIFQNGVTILRFGRAFFSGRASRPRSLRMVTKFRKVP